MNKVIQLTKKLTLRLSARKVRQNFTLINICYDRFIDYSVYLNLTFCNVTLRFTYENEKQREAIKKWHELNAEAENDF